MFEGRETSRFENIAARKEQTVYPELFICTTGDGAPAAKARRYFGTLQLRAILMSIRLGNNTQVMRLKINLQIAILLKVDGRLSQFR